MNGQELVGAANHLTTQRLLTRYLSASPRYAVFEVAGAIITVEPSRHRTGIPSNSRCQRYVVTHLNQGWSMVARAVWDQDGRLREPAATHVQIENYTDLIDHGSEQRAIEAVNRWLRDLDP